MLHHLGHAGGAGGKEDEQGVGAARGVRGAGEALGSGGPDVLVVDPAGRLLRGADMDEDLEGRAGGPGGFHARDHRILSDDGLDAGVVDPEIDVVGREQVGRGHGHGPKLVQGEHGHPPFHAAVEDDHDPVTFGQAGGLKGVGQPGRLLAEVGQVEIPADAVGGDMDHGRPGWVGGRLGVQEVEGEIIVVRHGDGNGLHQFTIRLGSQFGDGHGLGLPGQYGCCRVAILRDENRFGRTPRAA